jgi:hypothetical protein
MASLVLHCMCQLILKFKSSRNHDFAYKSSGQSSTNKLASVRKIYSVDRVGALKFQNNLAPYKTTRKKIS